MSAVLLTVDRSLEISRQVGTGPLESNPLKAQFLSTTSHPQRQLADKVSLPKVLYLSETPEKGYRFRRAFAVWVGETAESVVAYRDDLRLYAQGATLDEALSEFATLLLDLYDSYVHEPYEKLTEDAQALAAFLREVLVAEHDLEQAGGETSAP